MNRALAKQSIDDWQGLLRRSREQLVEREAPALPDPDMATALVGVRRCGKTSLALLMSRSIPLERTLYYNFEDPIFHLHPEVSNLDVILSVAEEFSPTGLELLILDEIQNIDGWERWLRKLIDLKRYRIIVTGSSAKLLSSELATALAGRCIEHRVWPLSWSETIAWSHPQPISPARLSAALRDFMLWGGFPGVRLARDEARREALLSQYGSDIVLKDVIQRHELRSKRTLDQILTYYFTNPSSLHSYTALRKAFGMTSDTAASYTEALKQAFLVFEVERYHPNLKVQTRDPKKVYAIDTGLRNVFARTTSDDTGKLLENIVFLDLMRRGGAVHYYRGAQEVDFVVTRRYQPRAAIQVCASDLSDQRTFDREVGGITECLDALDLEEGTIVTVDREETLFLSGRTVHCIPAPRWLARD